VGSAVIQHVTAGGRIWRWQTLNRFSFLLGRGDELLFSSNFNDFVIDRMHSCNVGNLATSKF
jgi:hypothetical protein